MCNAKADFIKLHQQLHQSVQEYYERFIAMREVNETLKTNIPPLGFVKVIFKEDGKDLATLTDAPKTDYMD